MWTWKYCSVKVLVQATRTPAATVSFLFLFLNLLVWLLQARQSSTFYEPHSSNGASLPLPTHNIPRTSRKQFYYSYYYIYIFYDQTTFFLLMGDLFYLQWVYLCSREIQEKEKGKGAETHSCMMQERPDELVIRCEKLTSCVTRWTWWSKKQGKMKKTCVFNTVVSH